MRTLAGLFLATAALLSGCASIPLSTAVRLSSLSPRSLAQTDPAEVRVKLSVPTGYELDPAASRLTLVLTDSSGKSRSGAMALELLQTTRENRPGGLFSSDVAVSTYVLALSPEGVSQLRQLQQYVLSGQAKEFQFSVQAPFSRVPSSASEVTFWADLKLSLHEPFMPLIDGAKIKFESPPASS